MSIGNTIRAGAAYVEVTAETSKLQRNLTSAQAQLQAFGRTCTSVGKDLLMLSGAMAVPLVMAAKSFASFDDSMRLVQAVTQATGEDFKNLTVLAQKLGRDTSYTAQQAADAMVALGRMGFSPKEIQVAIEDVLNLARATGTDLAEAGDIAANSLRIFGLEAGKMSDISDVLTVTANSSAQTLIDLFEALKMGGPQAAAAGESIRETCAALAVLANMGIKGSLAGTALRKSFSQFAKVKVQEQLRAVGVETLDANGNLRKMAEIMRDIAKVMQTMPSAEKLAFAEDIFDIRGSLAGLTLTANTDELDTMMAKLMDVEGVAADTAAKMDAGLGGSFHLLESAVEGVLNAIADAMTGTLQPFIKKVTDVINVITQWVERNQGLVTAFAIAVAGAATLGAALIALGIIAKGVSAGITVLQTATKGFAFVQGMCIAQATALKSSVLLIGQAFADYRNMAIPAMVGTEKFCAALGVASTAANRARASIILMSNTEAAAAAKSFLAAKWQAMTTALTAFRNSAIAATIATKAQAAAELALGAKTAVVNGWIAMTTALHSLTFASIKAAVAMKAQAVAEGAMTAGKSIAAAWTAMTTAISGLTVATITATAVTKAHAAAEVICTASTSALNAVRSAGIAIVAGFTAANLKAAIAVGAVAAGNFLLAAAAKVAAVAMMALSAVMSFVAAHPVAIALIALTAILAGVCIALYRAASYTAKLSDEATKLREKGDQLRQTDEARMERLQQLAQKQRLTNAEMAEARVLADKLQKKYGDLGISIKDAGIEISDLNAAVKRLDSVKIRIEAGDMPRFDRLKELSLKAKLTVDEQGEADRIIKRLENRYGSLGVTVDRITGKITRLNTVAANLQDIRLRVSGLDDINKANRLQQLAALPKLDTTQLQEARTLIEQLRLKYGEFGLTIDDVNGRIVTLTDAQRKFAEAVELIESGDDPLKETHLSQLQRLKQLTEQEHLTAEEHQEAESIVTSLNEAYAGLGLGIDAVTGKLRVATDAQKKFNNAMKEAAIAEIEAEITELQANIDELYRENQALDSYWNHNLMSQITGRQQQALDKTQTNNDKILAYRQRMSALRKRIRALEQDQPGAATGTEGNQPTVEERVQTERMQKQQEANDVAAAERRMAEIERKWRRDSQSDLDNQIQDIIELRDEYKKLIQTMLDYEKAKSENKQDKAKIAELERKLVEADRIADQQIATARAEAQVDVSDAERQTADIERRLRRERQSELDNEIEDIISLRDEYKKLIQTMLDFERAKDRDKQDQKKIAELERKLAQADKTARERIAAARAEAARRLQEDAAGFQMSFDDTERDIQKRRAEESQDRQIDQLLKHDKSAGIARLQQLIAQYRKAAQDAKEQFQRELQAAQSDGKIDNAERRRLNDAQSAFSNAQSLVDKYSGRLRQAQEGTLKAAEKSDSTRSVGAWSAEELDALLGGNGNAQERTAKASEQIVANTKETNRQLRRMKNNSNSTTLSYA